MVQPLGKLVGYLSVKTQLFTAKYMYVTRSVTVDTFEKKWTYCPNTLLKPFYFAKSINLWCEVTIQSAYEK